MSLLSVIPVEMRPMSIITLILLVAIVYILYMVYHQMQKDSKELEEKHKMKLIVIMERHEALEKEFESTREKLYDKINEVKDEFTDVKIAMGRTEEMIKGNAYIQKIIQKDISEIRERLNHKE